MTQGVRRLLQLGMVATVAIVFYYGVVFTGQLPYHWRVDGYNDLILHWGAFGLLTLFAVPAIARPRMTVFALVGFAVVIEVAQMAMPGRTASLVDLAASVAGVVLALPALLVISRLSARRASRQNSRLPEGIGQTGRGPG